MSKMFTDYWKSKKTAAFLRNQSLIVAYLIKSVILGVCVMPDESVMSASVCWSAALISTVRLDSVFGVM